MPSPQPMDIRPLLDELARSFRPDLVPAQLADVERIAFEVALVTDQGEQPMRPGECAGFKAGVRDGHCFQNRSSAEAVLLVVGSRSDADHGEYSDIDLIFTPGRYSSKGGYRRKDGTQY